MSSKDKITKLASLVYEDGEPFVPSEKEQTLVSEVVDLFRQTQSSRDRNFQYFDGLTIYDYIDDSVRRFNTNIDERDGIGDWQAGVHDPFTRNKVLGILGRVLEVLPAAQFIGRGDEDKQKGTILSELYEYVEELDDYEEFMIHYLLEAIVKGTAVGCEDIDIQEKTFRDVSGVGDDITVKESRENITRLYASIVPLEEFYPSSVSIRKVKEMPYCFWRKVVPYSKFVEIYGHLRKSQLVSGRQTFTADEARPYYHDFIDSNIPDGSVELIRFYDKMHDQYVVLANGIWLNPIKTKDGEGFEDSVSPLPWNHKELPFFDVKFDFFGDFFYGKSLPDRLKSLQDVLNVLTNMLLDQSFLTIFPPLLTNGFDSIEDDYIRPGRRTPVDTQGLPLDQAFKVLDMQTPSGWHQYILEYTRRVMEESSLDKVSQGVAGQGDRTTAQEIRTAASGVASMLQMFARMINTAVKRKAVLKASNLIQFGFNTEAPILRQVLGEGASAWAKEAFMLIKKEGSVLSGGKRGTKLISVYSEKAKMPERAQVMARAMVAKADSGSEVEIVAIPATYLRNFQFDVKLGLNPKNQVSKELDKAMQLEKVQIYGTFFPDLVNRQELAAETMEKMGDDPSKLLSDEALGIAPPPEAPGATGANANNMVRSAKGGEQGQAELASLMTQ